LNAEGTGAPHEEPGVDASPTVPPHDAAPPPVDAAMDANAPADAPVDVALDAPLDAAPIEAGGPCDQDGDGYETTGGTCNGNDCCDVDARVHPGQTSFYTSAGNCGSFDYDCDGKSAAEWQAVNCQLGFFTCSGDGFQDPQPGCGQTGTYATCNLGVFSCSTSTSSRVQACN
jgi:hypothetical protein